MVACRPISCCNLSHCTTSQIMNPTTMTVATAFTRALASLAEPRVLAHFIWPPIVSSVLWVVIAGFVLGAFDANAFAPYLPQSVSPEFKTFMLGLGQFAFLALVLLMLFPFITITSVILTGTIAVPLMVMQVASREYAALEKKKGGSLIGSVINALAATLILLLVAVSCLPLFLVPGVALVLPVLLAAWFNKKIYQYDALMDHASAAERKLLQSRGRGGLWQIALITAALLWVPVLNFFAPAIAGIAFVHFCLGRLHDLRATDLTSR